MADPVTLPPDSPPDTAHADPSPVDPAQYRRAVGRFATGVTVVTTRADGVDHALTANSFTSVSLDPVLVLVCVDRTARFCSAVQASGSWAVSVLAAGQEDHSRWFATHGRPDADQLAGFRWSRGPHTGAAVFDDTLASLECRTVATYEAGDHIVIIGAVLGVAAAAQPRPPLLYFQSRYRALSP